MRKGKVETWNSETEQADSYYFKKEKKLTPKQMEGNFSALMAGNAALLTAFFCCCAVGPASHSMQNAMLAMAGVSLGVIGAYSLRKNALNLLEKGGLLEVYSDMLKNLYYDVRTKITDNKHEKNYDMDNIKQKKGNLQEKERI
ncbi:MAG: hypothetical protein PHI76_03825 [Clostridia bacterium]|nr:hypothetical protein [Clostridia bacterium]